jgi:hypothetical protein
MPEGNDEDVVKAVLADVKGAETRLASILGTIIPLRFNGVESRTGA